MAAHRLYDRADAVPLICGRLATGETLAMILRGMDIPRRTVNQWRADDPEIAAQFDAARDDGFDAIASRTRATARGKGDSTADVQRDKLIIDTDLKLLAKWDPRRYGDRMTLAGDPQNPIMGLTDEQVDARLAALQAKLIAKPEGEA